VGEVKHVLTQDRYEAETLPYAGRFIIEDCVGETVHVHLGHLRFEFSPEQFLWFADHAAQAAERLRVLMCQRTTTKS
jgi:hypothetical protein